MQPHLPNKVFPDGILEIARISHNWSLNWSLISGQCLRSQDLIQQELSSWPPWTKAVALFSSPTCFSFPSVDKDRKYPQALQMREYGPPHGYCKTTVVLLASFALLRSTPSQSLPGFIPYWFGAASNPRFIQLGLGMSWGIINPDSVIFSLSPRSARTGSERFFLTKCYNGIIPSYSFLQHFFKLQIIQQWCVLLSFKNFFPLTTTSNQTSFWLFLWRSWTRWFFPVFPGVEMSWTIDARELALCVERRRDDWELSGDPNPSTSFLLLLGGERSDSGFGEGE